MMRDFILEKYAINSHTTNKNHASIRQCTATPTSVIDARRMSHMSPSTVNKRNGKQKLLDYVF